MLNINVFRVKRIKSNAIDYVFWNLILDFIIQKYIS